MRTQGAKNLSAREQGLKGEAAKKLAIEKAKRELSEVKIRRLKAEIQSLREQIRVLKKS